MSSSFTPVQAVDMSKEKDWPASLGMLDWDSTSIVFTKRSLIEFLKYTGTTVDPNFSNIGKLPRYAEFGKIHASESPESPQIPISGTSSVTDAADEFKPTRRVRTVPGGPHTDIFSQEDEGDALSTAPPKPAGPGVAVAPSSAASVPTPDDGDESGIDFGSRPKPSRRVRTNPGGNSSMTSFWEPAEPEVFKPTRRVRQGPGGQDNINGIF